MRYGPPQRGLFGQIADGAAQLAPLQWVVIISQQRMDRIDKFGTRAVIVDRFAGDLLFLKNTIFCEFV
jgi:hypothetical protein